MQSSSAADDQIDHARGNNTRSNRSLARRDVVRVKAIGSETAPRLFVMLKDAESSIRLSSSGRSPALQTRSAEAKFDVELCRERASIQAASACSMRSTERCRRGIELDQPGPTARSYESRATQKP
jgi:hypothetical protein